MWTRGRVFRLRSVIVLVVGLAVALPLDETVHDLAFRYVVSHEVRLLANGLTEFGTTAASASLLGALAVLGYRVADGVLWRGGLGGLAGLVLGGAATQVGKHVACRARPRLVEGWGVGALDPSAADAARRGFFHWPCFSRWRYHSFPSGHSSAAFAVAAALTAIAPGRRRLWLAVAAGVGASRVLVNAHFVSDVLAGGVIGWWAGQAGMRLVARLSLHRGTPPPRSAGVEARPPVGTPAA